MNPHRNRIYCCMASGDVYLVAVSMRTKVCMIEWHGDRKCSMAGSLLFVMASRDVGLVVVSTHTNVCMIEWHRDRKFFVDAS